MASAFWQTVTRFDASKLTPDIAFRNTVGVLLPLVAGVWLDNPAGAAVAALGALNVSYSDSREAYAVRGRRMLIASVLVAIAVAVGAVSAKNNIAAALAAMSWAFGVGMLVVLGPKAADLGLVTLVTLIVFAARQLSLKEALVSGAIALGGGLLQTALSVAIWPVRPYGPERRNIARLYTALADVATSKAGSESAPPASSAVVDAGAALASLQANLSVEAERLVFLLNQAERIRLSLLTLRRLAKRLKRDPQGSTPAQAIEHVLSLASGALAAIARQTQSPHSPSLHSMEEFGKAIREFHGADWPASSTMLAALLRDSKRHVSALAGQIRAAADLPLRTFRPRLPVTVAKVEELTSRKARILANMSFRSSAFRHAVRLSVCVGLGGAIAHGLHLERPYWVPMTIAIVLKPDFVSTFSRGILRIAGTLIGLFIATVLYHFLPSTPEWQIGLLTFFMVMLRWIGPGNYGIFVAAVSGMIVLLMALTGISPSEVVAPRTINTVLGGALALFIYWIWPTWEREQLGTVLGDMLDVYRVYIRDLAHARTDPAARRAIQSARNAGRLARSNAEASVSRFVAEPGVSKERRALLSEILISSHAFARAAMAIETDLDSPRAPETVEPTHQFAEAVDRALESMATALRTNKPPANFPDVRNAWTAIDTASRAANQSHSLLVEETDRLATSVNTLREQIVKWVGNKA